MIWVLLFLVVVVFISVFHLRGQNLSQFDSPPGQSFATGHEPSDEHEMVVASLNLAAASSQRVPRKQRISLMREYMNDISRGRGARN